MPFVNIRIYEGWGKDNKDEIARRVTDAISRRDQAAERGGVGGVRGSRSARLVRRRASPGSGCRSDDPTVSIRDPRFTQVVGNRRRVRADRHRAASSRRARSGTRPGSISSGATCPAITCAAGRPRTASPRSASRATSPTASRGTVRAGSLACEHASSQVSRTEPDGRIVAARHALRGQAAQQPERRRLRGGRRHLLQRPALRPRRVLRRPARRRSWASRVSTASAPDPKRPALLVDDFDRPNGLCFSLDGRRLFVNDTARQHIRVFDVKGGRRRSPAARCGRRPRARARARPTG